MKTTLVAIVLLTSSTLLAQSLDQPPATEAPGMLGAKRTPYFVDPSAFDLSLILPLPPAQDSATAKEELAYVHRVEQTRTPEQIAAAQADDREEDLFIFAKVIGPKFTKDDLPLTAALSAHVHNDEAVMSEPLKGIYKRLRPYNYDGSLHPVCKTDKEFSYPSGHSVSGYLLAFTMAQIVPEKRERILERANDYAHNRVVCGVHYPSDTEASRRMAYAIFGSMMANSRFNKDLAAARAETRAHLGLPSVP
ncbi:acid phosphatase [Edaphobacter modestus]|uniref:acid phosphatase n=1 Tax=Edaphobacter modestus TaxID=388466 RepID=UPI001F5FDFD3|nr:phosphatase PAP2 family protein [Edaphobacter modestus]